MHYIQDMLRLDVMLQESPQDYKFLKRIRIKKQLTTVGIFSFQNILLNLFLNINRPTTKIVVAIDNISDSNLILVSLNFTTTSCFPSKTSKVIKPLAFWF